MTSKARANACCQAVRPFICWQRLVVRAGSLDSIGPREDTEVMAMDKHRVSAGAFAIAVLFLMPSIAGAQSVSIELVEARAMTVGRAAPASQPTNTIERTSTNQERSAAAQTSAPASGHRTSLRESARRGEHAAVHRRSSSRDDVRMGRAAAAGSVRCQSDVAEHRQQRRGATHGGPANAGGNGKGANAE